MASLYPTNATTFLPNHNTKHIEGGSTKQLTNTLQSLKVIKDKERLRNYYRLRETKETWQSNMESWDRSLIKKRALGVKTGKLRIKSVI